MLGGIGVEGMAFRQYSSSTGPLEGRVTQGAPKEGPGGGTRVGSEEAGGWRCCSLVAGLEDEGGFRV